MMQWQHDGIDFSIRRTDGQVSILRRDRVLGRFDDSSFRAWEDALDERPPVPGMHAPFPNDYIARVAWSACLARKKEMLERSMRRAYSPSERRAIIEEFVASGKPRNRFARERGIPEGTIARWATAWRSGMSACSRLFEVE